MSNKTRLTQKMIKRIVELRETRMPWGKVAEAIGVSVRTLQNWRTQGKQDTKGVYAKLDRDLKTSDEEHFQRYATVVRNAALYGRKTVTTKKKRNKSGKMVIDEIYEKVEPPDDKMALKLLQTFYPEVYREIQKLEHTVDWRQPVAESGSDPDEVQKNLTELMLKVSLPATENN